MTNFNKAEAMAIISDLENKNRALIGEIDEQVQELDYQDLEIQVFKLVNDFNSKSNDKLIYRSYTPMALNYGTGMRNHGRALVLNRKVIARIVGTQEEVSEKAIAMVDMLIKANR